MKKLLLLLIGSACGLPAFAQKTVANKYPDSNLYRVVLDLNLTGGALMQNITKSDVNSLTNPTLTDIGSLKFTKGNSFGFDGQLGMFFGKKRHWGVGAGIAYFSQRGDMTLDKYNVSYQATDASGHNYTQLVTATAPIVENLKITNVNIPLLLKYKNRFSKNWGFTADAGIMFNLSYKNSYTTNATFNYGAEGQVTPYNVGNNVSPTSNTGDYSYSTGSVGYFLQPSMNLFLSDVCALNFGLYYLYQPVKNSNGNTNQVTDKKGDYNSILRSVGTSNNQNIGLNVGVRFFIGKLKDTDHDGTPDKRDKCPTIPGPGELFGCPDFDHDGIPDCEDSCPRQAGPYKFHGCPDTDGDGVPDREDACPGVPGLITLHGCPDRDGDGIPDKDDACPDVKGLAKYKGCPDTDGDGIPDNEDQCPNEIGPESNHGCPVVVAPPPPPPHIDMTTPILFEVNKDVVSSESYPILDEAVRVLGEDKSVAIVIDGYTDNSGTEVYNKILSVKRANAVRKYLVEKGASTKRLKIVGHGPKDPVAENETPEGRAKNRRATMHVKGK